MPSPLGPGYSALSRGRFSAPGETYFLTFNLQRPQRGLADPPLLDRLIAEGHGIEREGDWLVRTGVIMPDHVHLVVRMGENVTLSEAVRRYKGGLAPALREQGLHWQRSFFDHRMRHGDDVLPVFLYVYLNPFRAGLVNVGERWPGYHCAPADWAWFGPLTSEGAPFPEWLADRGD